MFADNYFCDFFFKKMLLFPFDLKNVLLDKSQVIGIIELHFAFPYASLHQ